MSHRRLLLFVLFCFSVISQVMAQGGSTTVTGVIKDKSGGPLEAITVSEKGTSRKTITDASGAFSISVAGTDAVLIISGVGFETQEVKASGVPLNIVLAQTTT